MSYDINHNMLCWSVSTWISLVVSNDKIRSNHIHSSFIINPLCLRQHLLNIKASILKQFSLSLQKFFFGVLFFLWVRVNVLLWSLFKTILNLPSLLLHWFFILWASIRTRKVKHDWVGIIHRSIWIKHFFPISFSWASPAWFIISIHPWLRLFSFINRVRSNHLTRPYDSVVKRLVIPQWYKVRFFSSWCIISCSTFASYNFVFKRT